MKNFVEFDLKNIVMNDAYADNPEYVNRFNKLNKHIQSFKWPGNISDYQCDTDDKQIAEQLDTNVGAKKLVESANMYSKVLETKMKYLTNLVTVLHHYAESGDFTRYDMFFKEYLAFERKRKMTMLFGVLTVACLIGAVVAGLIWLL